MLNSVPNSLIGSRPTATHSTLEEGEELQDALQDALRELDGELGRDADVLGDAAVGIVDFVGQQAELVLAARMQPALDGDAATARSAS